jgi:uncharacterized protein (TIGR03437 family)
MKSTLFRPAAIAVLAFAVPIAALADISGTVTLAANTALNLDTGTTASSGGDILWTGTGITFQGSAKGGSLAALGLSGSAGFTTVTQSILQELASFSSTSPILVSALPVGTIVGVSTNGGNSSKLLVTAQSGSSITLQYLTYEAAAPTGPTVTGVTNNYSFTPTGFPNSGLAQGSVIVIFGTGLANSTNAVLQSSLAPGIPMTLNGASVSVTVGGTTVKLGLYYAVATAIAAVLPSGTPTGNGTLTVTNGTASNAFAITVVPSAFGFDTYYGTGNGLVVATNPFTGALYNYTNSAAPGATVTFWGSGLGADLADSDTIFAPSPHPVNVPLQIYIGGVLASISYAGSSGYPGVDIVNVTIPASVPTGCFVSVIGVISNVVTNSTVLPINQGGGACSDPTFGINGTTISSLSGQGTVKSGSVDVIQGTTQGANGSASTVSSIAIGSFQSHTGGAYGANSGITSIGSCTVTQTASGGSIGSATGLDAGTIKVTGPAGSATLTESTAGSYVALLPAGSIPSTGGTFTFTGSGGTSVGPFTANVTFPNPLLSWTNQASAATVTRTQGLQVTWTGGASGSFVIISGSSSSVSGANASYTCLAPLNAGQFTVPSYVLLFLPAGTGSTFVENSTSFSTFAANGLDSGGAFGGVFFQVNSTYN